MHFTPLLQNITDNAADHIISIVYGCIRCQYISKYTTGLYMAGISKIPDNICCPVRMFMSHTCIIIILMCQSYIPRVQDVYQNLLASIRCQEYLLQMTFHISCDQIQHQFGVVVHISSAIVSGRYSLHFDDFGCNGLLDIILYIVCNQLIIGGKISSQSIAVFFINGKFVPLTNLLGKLITASVAVICRIYQCCIIYVHGHRSIIVCEIAYIATVSPCINMRLQCSYCNVTLHMVRFGILVSIHRKRIRIT